MKLLLLLAVVLWATVPAQAQPECPSKDWVINDRTEHHPEIQVTQMDKETADALIAATIKSFPQPDPRSAVAVDEGLAFDGGDIVEVIYFEKGCGRIQVNFDKALFASLMGEGA